MSKFDEIIDKARDKEARKEATKASRAERKRLAIEANKQKSTRTALAASNVMPIVATVGFATLLCVAFFAVKTQISIGLKRAIVISSVVGAFVVLFGGLASGWQAKRQIAWMQSLPFDIALAAYFGVLSIDRDTATPQVRVGFKSVPSSQERETISLVVNELMSTATAAWRGDQLVITGPTVVTSKEPYDQRITGGSKSYNNGRIHMWVRSCIRKVLLVVHSEHPISTVWVSA